MSDTLIDCRKAFEVEYMEHYGLDTQPSYIHESYVDSRARAAYHFWVRAWHHYQRPSEISDNVEGKLCAELSNYLYEATNTKGSELRTHVQAVWGIVEPYVLPVRETVDDKWKPIKTAPFDTAVLVCTFNGYVFPARLKQNYSLDENMNQVNQWVAEIDGFHPPCWSEGACWSSNTEESESDQPIYWRPRVHQIEDREGGK